MWLEKSQQINQAMAQYNETGTIPPPEKFGFELRPLQNK
jgi:hypothetical protein